MWKALKMPSTTTTKTPVIKARINSHLCTQEKYTVILTAKKNCSLLSFKESSYSWKQLLVHVFNNHILWGEITLKATNFFFYLFISELQTSWIQNERRQKKKVQQDVFAFFLMSIPNFKWSGVLFLQLITKLQHGKLYWLFQSAHRHICIIYI